MEINVNGKNIVLRNLEEQVQKNKEDIARHYAIDRALANFGIKVVGSVTASKLLPGQESGYAFPMAPGYTGAFGDAYVVGTKPPYTYWIYTRPDLNQGYTQNYWLDVGEISVQGPEGKPGIQGPQGPAGVTPKIIFGATAPTDQVTTKGDVFVISQGNSLGYTYQYDGQNWVYIGDFKGPQGIQGIRGLQGERGIQGPVGPQGKAGTPGPAFYIAGIFADISDLAGYVPTDRNAGYLIGTGIPYTLYLYINDLWTPVSDNFISVQGEPGAQGPQGIQGRIGEQGMTGPAGYSIYSYNGELDASMIGAAVSYAPALIIKDTLEVKPGDLLLDNKGRLFKITSTVGEYCAFTGTELKAAPDTAHPITYTITANAMDAYYGNLIIPIPKGNDIDRVEIIGSINYQSYDNSVHYNELQNVVIRDGGVNVEDVTLSLYTGYTGTTVNYPTYWATEGLELDVYTASQSYWQWQGSLALIIRITTK